MATVTAAATAFHSLYWVSADCCHRGSPARYESRTPSRRLFTMSVNVGNPWNLKKKKKRKKRELCTEESGLEAMATFEARCFGFQKNGDDAGQCQTEFINSSADSELIRGIPCQPNYLLIPSKYNSMNLFCSYNSKLNHSSWLLATWFSLSCRF